MAKVYAAVAEYGEGEKCIVGFCNDKLVTKCSVALGDIVGFNANFYELSTETSANAHALAAKIHNALTVKGCEKDVYRMTVFDNDKSTINDFISYSIK